MYLSAALSPLKGLSENNSRRNDSPPLLSMYFKARLKLPILGISPDPVSCSVPSRALLSVLKAVPLLAIVPLTELRRAVFRLLDEIQLGGAVVVLRYFEGGSMSSDNRFNH